MPEQSAEVQVYRTRMCPFCVAAAAFLDQRGIRYDEVFLDNHPDRQAVTEALLPNHRTVPLIVIDGAPLGGFDQLRAADASGDLQRRVFAGGGPTGEG